MQICLNDDTFVVNALIEIHRKEGRRIIDEEDVLNYHRVLEENLAERGLFVIRNEGVFASKFFDEVRVVSKDKKKYYAMLPWIEEEELVENYRNFLPYPYMLSMMDPMISQKLLSKSNVELDYLHRIYFSMLNQLYENISSVEVHDSNKVMKKNRRLEAIQRLRRSYE